MFILLPLLNLSGKWILSQPPLQLSQQGHMLVLCIRTSDTGVRTASILLLLVFWVDSGRSEPPETPVLAKWETGAGWDPQHGVPPLSAMAVILSTYYLNHLTWGIISACVAANMVVKVTLYNSWYSCEMMKMTPHGNNVFFKKITFLSSCIYDLFISSMGFFRQEY